ncbi:hypothetical protein HOW07_12535 [Plantibacter sp. MCCC 1A11337]|uniref:helix-turn-helix domain-containing protein n=1 Tax=Plantibacter sp. MCCC 1A11337 TaxID=2736644 RepID=UPI001582A334|nr:hypothetical protein [Plantibacter sp. MCCC 1A11337]NUJ88834.1 hypothetical protein [Plantibacter sp. MCCC 1A11337]
MEQKRKRPGIPGLAVDPTGARSNNSFTLAPRLDRLHFLLKQRQSHHSKSDDAVQPVRLSRRLSPETVAEIVEKYEAGVTTPALCAEHSLSKGGLLKVLGERGVEMRRQSLDAAQLREAVRLYETGLSLQAVATRLGVSYNCVRQRFVKESVPRRPRGGSYTR